MTAKHDTILAFFDALEDAGYTKPKRWSDPAAYQRALVLWDNLTFDLSPQKFLGAGMAWMRDDEYRQWPVPGSVIKYGRELGASLKLTADEAWGVMRKSASHKDTRTHTPVATQAEVDAYDPEVRGLCPFLAHEHHATAVGIVAGVKALGGFRKVGVMSSFDEVANRASFRKAYDGATGRAEAKRVIEGAKNALEQGRNSGLLEVKR